MDTRRCRLTGHETTVGTAKELGLDPELPYYVVCEEHHTLLGTETRRNAERHRARPDGWCQACREELYEITTDAGIPDDFGFGGDA